MGEAAEGEIADGQQRERLRKTDRQRERLTDRDGKAKRERLNKWSVLNASQTMWI